MSQESQKGVTSKRYWLITWNNPPEDWVQALISLKPNWFVGQLEQGEQGTRHIQALLWYRERVANSFWKGKSVWSKAVPSSDIDNLIAYCTKEETRIEGPRYYGKMPNHAKRSEHVKRNVRNWQAALDLAKEGRVKEIEASILIPYVQNLRVISTMFGESVGTDSPRGVWIVGAPGTGKSYYARRNYPEAYIKAQNKWWDGYSGQKSVILDDLDKLGTCLGHYLKIWLDQYPFSPEVKGGTVATSYKTFVITSNYWPNELFDDEVMAEAISRRCKFVHFTGFCEYDVGADYGVKPQSTDEYLRQFIDNL